jgi:hypothetical protein
MLNWTALRMGSRAGTAAARGATAIESNRRRRVVRSTSRFYTSEADSAIISPSSAGKPKRVRCRD